MKRTARTLTTSILLTCGTLNTCSGELDARVDTAAEAQAKLQQGKQASAFILQGTVWPKGGAEGETTVYNPLRFEGNTYWYTVCSNSGKIVLKKLVKAHGATYIPDGHIIRSHSGSNMHQIAAQIVPLDKGEPCGIKAVGILTEHKRVAFTDTPTVE